VTWETHAWIEVMENGGRNGGLLEKIEGLVAGGRPFPAGVLARQARKWDSNFGKLGNELAIIVNEPQKRLNILDVPWDRPISYDLNFRFAHPKAFWANNVSKELCGRNGEFALLYFGVEFVGAKSVQNVPYVSNVNGGIFGIDQYVI
jgi:hypothetical protein